MPIDASIPLQVQTPNLAQVYMQAQQLKGMQQEQQLRSLSLAQATQAIKDSQDLRNAYSQAGGDPTKAIDALKTINPYVGAQEGARVAKVQQEQAKTQGDITKTDLANHAAKAQRFASLLSTATPENYGSVLNQAVSEGVITPQEIEQHGLGVYNPDTIKQTMQATVSFADQAKQKLDQDTLAETKRNHDLLDERARMTSPQQGRAIEIYAKPKSQWTPEEAAFIKGYEKNVDVTRTQPGAVRAQIYAQMPIAVADPENPGRVMFTTKQNAIGKEAPNSIDTKTAQNVTKYFTTGEGAKTMTAFNTAQGHLQAYREAAQALKNGDLKALNAIANEYGVQTGQSAPLVFQAVKTALTGELGKAFTGTGATVDEQHQLSESMNRANSLQQNLDVANTFDHLLQSKKQALIGQYTMGLKAQPNFEPAKTEAPKTVKLKAPNGQIADVPADQVEHYKSLGATEVK